MESIRWAVNFASWKPTRGEWVKAIQCIQSEEKDRISRFVYAKDAKASLVGRLLIRKLFVEKLGIANDILKLGRNDKEKPYVINEISLDLAPSLSFNVSHQGAFTVLAAESDRPVGVDVMKIHCDKSASDFFKTMDRQFTDSEWQRILIGVNDKEKLANFYRNWCLKESYVKAVGVGISFNLKRLSFIISNDDLVKAVIRQDTQLKIDNSLVTNWVFQETMLDDDHCVAVALGPQTKLRTDQPIKAQVKDFVILNFEDMIKSLAPINYEDIDDWEKFRQKPEYPF